MSNDKQQTAVEWYIERLLDLDYQFSKELISLDVYSTTKVYLQEKAKEMEMNQTIKFGYTQFDHCVLRHGGLLIQKLPEDLWEEIYGGSTED